MMLLIKNTNMLWALRLSDIMKTVQSNTLTWLGFRMKLIQMLRGTATAGRNLGWPGAKEVDHIAVSTSATFH